MGEAEQDLQDAAQTRALPARDGRIQVVVGDEVKQLQKTADGRTYEDGVLNLSDGREMSWRWWGDPDGTPILRIQGTPGSRKQYNPNPNVQREVGARYLMADRAGYGGSMRKPGRGIADIADDYVALRGAHGLDRVPATGTSGGGPHVLALAALHPDRVASITVVVGGTPLVAGEVSHLVGVNARGYQLAEQGWEQLHEVLVEVRKRLLGDEGMQVVLG